MWRCESVRKEKPDSAIPINAAAGNPTAEGTRWGTSRLRRTTAIPIGTASALNPIVTAPRAYSELPPCPVPAAAKASAATSSEPSP